MANTERARPRMAMRVCQAADADTLDLEIYDTIGADFWTGEGVTAKSVRDALKASGAKKVHLSVNSGGGDAFEGVAIHNILRQHREKAGRGAKITADVDGIAASAASIIVAAADEVNVPANAAIMIHEAWSVIVGTAGEMEKRAGLLRQINTSAADTYVESAQRRGVTKTRDEMLALMAEETWLFGSEAVEAGLADAETPALEAAASIDLSLFAKASEVKARLPELKTTTPADGQENAMNAEQMAAIVADLEAEKAACTKATADATAAAELAAKAESDRVELEAKLATIEAEKAADAERAAAEQAKLQAELNAREVQALVGVKLYPAELEPMTELRASSPELFARLMASRPDLKILADVTGDDKPVNSLTSGGSADAQLAAIVREAGKE